MTSQEPQDQVDPTDRLAAHRAPAPRSIDAQRAARAFEAGPTHPKLAATLLMVGIVVLLVAIAAAPLLGR